MAKAELASAFCSQCTQARKEHKPLTMLFRDHGSSPSSKLRLDFCSLNSSFPPSPRSSGWAPWLGQQQPPSSTITSSFHKPKPSQRDSPSSKASSQRRTGQSARSGGGSRWSFTPHRPCRGGCLRRCRQTSPQAGRGAGENSGIRFRGGACSDECFASPLSPFIFAEGLKLAHPLGRCTAMAQPTSCHPALPVADGFLVLGKNAIKSKPPTGMRTLRSYPGQLLARPACRS